MLHITGSDAIDTEINGSWQVKLAASSMLPDPLYRATAGYGQRGRVQFGRDAISLSGAVFLVTHSSSAGTASN
jgi:hypothetical protein